MDENKVIKMKFQIVDRGGNGLLLRNIDSDGNISQEYYFDLEETRTITLTKHEGI